MTARSTNLIHVMTGGESFPDRSAQAQVYIVPKVDDRFDEHPIWKVAEHGTLDIREIVQERLPIAEGWNFKAGSWTRGTWNVPDGTLIKLHMKRHPGWDTQMYSGSVFFEVDSSAPGIEYRFKLSESNKAAFPYGTIMGRMHRLTLEEALPLLKVKMHPARHRMFSQASVDKMTLEMIELSSGLPRPEVLREEIDTDEGTVVVETPMRRRKIKV